MHQTNLPDSTYHHQCVVQRSYLSVSEQTIKPLLPSSPPSILSEGIDQRSTMTTPFCDDCIKVVKHEGTPLGKERCSHCIQHIVWRAKPAGRLTIDYRYH